MTVQTPFDRRALWLGVSALALVPALAVAQEFDGEEIRLKPIQVIGELQTRDLQDSQTSAAVYTGEELDESLDVELYDLIERTPNVTGTFGEQGFAIRGIDQRGPGGAGAGLLVNITVDGAAVPSNQATFFGPYSVWDVDQVEVLRGPQSTQRGRNALAGAIVIETADPTFDYEFKARASYAEYETRRGAFAVNIPIVDDILAARVAFERAYTDGFTDNPTRGEDDFDKRNLAMGRGKLRFKPNEAFDAVLSLSYTHNEGGQDYISYPGFPDDRENFSNDKSVEGSDHMIYGLEATYSFSDRLSLESNTSWYVHDYERREDSDNSPTPGLLLDRDMQDKSITQELRLKYDGDWIRYVLGGYFTRIDTSMTSDSTFDSGIVDPGLAGLGVLTLGFNYDIDTTNYAAFGEVELDFLKRWTLTLGGRYDIEEVEQKDATTYSLSPPLIPLPPNEIVRQDAQYEAFLPKLGLTYAWTDDLSTSFTVQRAYRAGGAQRNLFTGVLNEYDPEYAWNYEVALRSEWFQDRMTVNANLFYLDWTDQQVNLAGPSGNPNDFNTVNAGESEVMGGEIEIRARPIAPLDVFFALGYTETEFTDFETGGTDYTGNEFAFAPSVTLAFGGSYFFGNGLELHADANYQDESFGDEANSPLTEIEDRFLVNGRFGYDADVWSVYLFGRNIFDEEYITQVTSDRSLARVGDPRVVGIQANVEF